MDNAIWATWYDLPAAGRDEYLDWLHGDYLPALRARPGVLWTAHYRSDGGGAAMQALRGEIFPRHDYGGLDIGTGTQYLMLVGASEPWTLLAPNIFDEQAALTGTARTMLDRRTGVRPCLFAVFARVNGPEVDQRAFGTTPGPAIQMGSFRTVAPEDEYDVGA